ncbi:MAG: hypothetical protein J2P30_17665 [Actinobacteria bacterium]|nr:hypothetical protein [Actinomycetota bacterium]
MNENPQRQERPERAPDTLDRWAAAASAELGIEPPGDFMKTVLNLARVAAHRVDRPAAPLTAFLLGIAVGQGRSLPEPARQLQELAQAWPREAGG